MTSVVWLYPVSKKERTQSSSGWILGYLPGSTRLFCALHLSFRCFTIHSLLKVKSLPLFLRLLACTVQVRQVRVALWRWTFTLVCDMVMTNSAPIPRIFVLEGEGALLKEMHWKPTVLKRVQVPKWQKKTNFPAFYSWKEEGKTVHSRVLCRRSSQGQSAVEECPEVF